MAEKKLLVQVVEFEACMILINDWTLVSQEGSTYSATDRLF
jgi:hypothetical protein